MLIINFDTILIKTTRKTLYIFSDLAFVTGFLIEVVKISSVRETITKYQRAAKELFKFAICGLINAINMGEIKTIFNKYHVITARMLQ